MIISELGAAIRAFLGFSALSLAFGLTIRFVFGFANCSGLAVGPSSTIGAGDRCAIIKIENKMIGKRSDQDMASRRRQSRHVMFSVRAAIIGAASPVIREL